MAQYTIETDRDACIGDRLCCEEAPGTFDVDEEGKVVIINPEGDLPEYVLAAARSCPLEAIILRDAETGEQVWPEED